MKKYERSEQLIKIFKDKKANICKSANDREVRCGMRHVIQMGGRRFRGAVCIRDRGHDAPRSVH